MEIMGIIPARGGSKGIPNKNIIEISGRAMIEYTYEAAENSRYLSRIILSTDSNAIAQTASARGRIEIQMRDQRLATDDAKTSDVIDDLLKRLYDREEYIPDYIVILQPTSPLRTAEDIDNCIRMLLNDITVDSVVSVCKVPHSHIPEKIMILENGYLKAYCAEGDQYTTRQKVPAYYARNGAAVYAFKTEVFKATHSYYGEKCLPYMMSEECSIDIDTRFDLELARHFMEQKKSTKCQEEV